MVCTYNGLLLRLKKEGNSDTCYCVAVLEEVPNGCGISGLDDEKLLKTDISDGCTAV